MRERTVTNTHALPDGFKQTEIELIPEEWEVTELGDVCQHRRELVEPQKNGVIRYVGLEHIDSGSPKLQRHGSDSEVRSSKSRFYAGDVLYGKLRPYLDKAVLAEWEGICSTDILVFKSLEERAIPEFLVHLLHTSNFLAHAINTTSGVNHPRTSWGDIKTFKFARPPLPEQRAIAHVLSKIQAAAQAQAAIAERARELKRALMAKLFTEGLRGEPLKETEIGAMPESWEVVRLGDVCEFLQYGTSERCGSDTSGIPVLRIPNVVEGRIDLGDLKFLKTSSKTVESLRLAVGDLLFVRTNGRREYTGRCAVFKGELQEALFASYLIRARLKPETLLPDFLQLYTEIEEGRGQLGGRASGAADGKFNINTQTIRAVSVSRPSLDEQRETIRILQTVDVKITAAERKRAGLEELFRAMLGELMTGRVRAKGVIS